MPENLWATGVTPCLSAQSRRACPLWGHLRSSLWSGPQTLPGRADHQKRGSEWRNWGPVALVVQWLRLCTPNTRSLGLIPGQGSRSHKLQLRVHLPKLKIPHAIAKSRSVQFSRSVVSDSLWPHESQHARPPCPSQTPGVYSNSCLSSQWYHPVISSRCPLLLLPPIPPASRADRAK